jgi:hypothetical protein
MHNFLLFIAAHSILSLCSMTKVWVRFPLSVHKPSSEGLKKKMSRGKLQASTTFQFGFSTNLFIGNPLDYPPM